MYSFFDKHGKKLLAVFSVLLMVAFLQSPYQAYNPMGGHAGKINGVALNPDDYNNDVAVLERLNLIRVPMQVPGQGYENISIGERVLPGAFARFHQNPLAWHLLVSEARQAGVMPTDADIDSVGQGTYFMLDHNGQRQPVPFAQLSADGQNMVRANLRVLLSVYQNFERSMQAIKISTPLLEDEVAFRTQKVRARFAVLDAAKFEGSVDADLNAQFNAYSNIPEGMIDPKSNPFGFGYRVPDRVKLQYLKIPTADIQKTVIDSKKPEMWEEDARMFYEKNKQVFAELPKPDASTSQPSSQPASTQPVILPFEQVSERVYNSLRMPMFEARRKAIVNAITSRLNLDYQNASKSFSATTQQVVETKVNELAVGSEEYLRKIQADISKQFGVNIEMVIDARLLSAEELMADASLGMAFNEDGMPPQNAAQYIFTSIKQFVSDKDKDRAAVALNDLYQPLKPLVSTDATYIVRVVEAQPAHPPVDLSAVKDRVERDVRRKKAFDQVVAQAEAYLPKAKESGLGSISELKLYTTDFLNYDSVQIKDLPDSDRYAPDLISQIIKLQRQVTDKTKLNAYSVIKLPEVDKVAVVELFDVKNEVDTNSVRAVEYMARNSISSQLVQLGTQRGAQELFVMQQWFDMDSVSKRVGYVPEVIEGEPKHPDKSPKSAPGSPFVPG